MSRRWRCVRGMAGLSILAIGTYLVGFQDSPLGLPFIGVGSFLFNWAIATARWS